MDNARLDKAMLFWFLPGEDLSSRKQRQLTESNLKDISDTLRRFERIAWSRIPRIYAVLHAINELTAIDVFLNSGITDTSFPFSQRTLPEAFKDQASRCNFIEVQAIVLTKALDLEKENGRHRHFANPTDVPFEKVAELGKGAYGYVDRVYSTISYKEYARKLIPRGRTFRKDRAVLQDFERELGALKKLSHLHIVELIGSYTDPRYVGVIMSPVADCNLKDFLEAGTISQENRSFLRTFYDCLAAALRYLHENRVRHKDIKPQNVLVKAHCVYLTDFGTSLDWSEFDHSMTEGPTVKTLRYCPPEVALAAPRKSSADIWSLGCVFLEIWTVLCGSKVAELNTHMISTGSFSSSYHANIPSMMIWIRSLASRSAVDGEKPTQWIVPMLQEKPTDRYTAQVVFEKIQDASLDPEAALSFAGSCCVEDADTDESVDSWSLKSDGLRVSEDVIEPQGSVYLKSEVKESGTSTQETLPFTSSLDVSEARSFTLPGTQKHTLSDATELTLTEKNVGEGAHSSSRMNIATQAETQASSNLTAPEEHDGMKQLQTSPHVGTEALSSYEHNDVEQQKLEELATGSSLQPNARQEDTIPSQSSATIDVDSAVETESIPIKAITPRTNSPATTTSTHGSYRTLNDYFRDIQIPEAKQNACNQQLQESLKQYARRLQLVNVGIVVGLSRGYIEGNYHFEAQCSANKLCQSLAHAFDRLNLIYIITSTGFTCGWPSGLENFRRYHKKAPHVFMQDNINFVIDMINIWGLDFDFDKKWHKRNPLVKVKVVRPISYRPLLVQIEALHGSTEDLEFLVTGIHKQLEQDKVKIKELRKGKRT